MKEAGRLILLAGEVGFEAASLLLGYAALRIECWWSGVDFKSLKR